MSYQLFRFEILIPFLSPLLIENLACFFIPQLKSLREFKEEENKVILFYEPLGEGIVVHPYFEQFFYFIFSHKTG